MEIINSHYYLKYILLKKGDVTVLINIRDTLFYPNITMKDEFKPNIGQS